MRCDWHSSVGQPRTTLADGSTEWPVSRCELEQGHLGDHVVPLRAVGASTRKGEGVEQVAPDVATPTAPNFPITRMPDGTLMALKEEMYENWEDRIMLYRLVPLSAEAGDTDD